MDVKLPHLGEGADSGTVVNLFVKEGDRVSKDQPILELENEKAIATIPSSGTGTITRIFVKPGDKLSVGQPILSLGAEAGAATAPKPATERQEPRAIQTPSPEQEPAPVEEPAGVSAEGAVGGPAAPVAAAPWIRKLARDLGLDLTRIRGSARGGRIVIEDVRVHVQRLQRLAAAPRTAAPAAAAAPPPAPEAPAAEPIDFSKWGPVTTRPLSPLRQVIARRMAENWNAVPRVTQFDEADITDLMELRKRYAGAYEKQGARLTLTSFALKVVVDTLKRHPVFNSSLDEAAQQLVMKQYYHLGVAVDTEAGLMVPVFRDVDRKGLLELSKELEDLAAKARDRKVSGEELKGGTFTISNQGGIGGGPFTPIVNKPEVAILGLGRAALKAVVRQGRIEARLMVPLALAYDHRVIDGGAAARFMVDLVQAFQAFGEQAVKLPS